MFPFQCIVLFSTAIICNPPYAPDDGYIKTVGTSYRPGETISFACNQGFQLDGPSTLTCDEYGDWDDYEPLCTGEIL